MNADRPLPFALPDITEAEIEAVGEALRSGWVSSGPRVRQFEQDFAERLGTGLFAVAVSSATAGLHLALEAIGVGIGDEILVPTWTFTATAEVVRYLGAEPILVDVDRESLNIDLVCAQELVTPRTRAIMPVHFAGLPVDPALLEDFAARNLIDVVEDAAHAFPAARGGMHVGAGSSAATVFSFYATKTITTGEGGMLVTRDKSIAERARIMRLHGISRDAFDRYRATSPAWRYEVVAPGFKYNLTDPAAAMGLVQLARADQMRDRRRDLAVRYDAAFVDAPFGLPLHGSSDTNHAWHLYVIRLEPETDRDAFIAAMSDQGVATSVHFIPLHLHPYWKGRRASGMDDLPVATSEFERVVSLPLFSSMTIADQDRVIEATLKAVSA